jgi:hypothetical protein
MPELETQDMFILFNKTMDDFLSDLKQNGLKYNKRVEELENDIKEEGITDYIYNYNESIKKYEKRFLNKDIAVIGRISNKIFGKLKMSRVLSEISDENRDIVWGYLKALYLYSEIGCQKREPKELSELIETCKPEPRKKKSMDSRIEEATDMISNLMGLSGGGSNEMSSLKELVKSIGLQMGDEIKNNGGEIDTVDVMKTFSKMMNGGGLTGDSIGGIDMKKIIDNAYNCLSDKVKSGEIDMAKFQEESKEKFDIVKNQYFGDSMDSMEFLLNPDNKID